MDVLGQIGQGLWNAFQMAWEVWWALVLGFLLSGIVQAWVPRARLERALGGGGPRTLALATGLGAASSSCSYAAVAIAKSLFQKGASLAAAMVFQFASTNLVFEIGIVLWVFLGWEFTLAEFVGGLVLILLMWFAVRLLVSRQQEERARQRAIAADTGHMHHSAGGLGTALAAGLVGRGPQLPRRLGDALEGDHCRLRDRRVRRAAAEVVLQPPLPDRHRAARPSCSRTSSSGRS